MLRWATLLVLLLGGARTAQGGCISSNVCGAGSYCYYIGRDPNANSCESCSGWGGTHCPGNGCNAAPESNNDIQHHQDNSYIPLACRAPTAPTERPTGEPTPPPSLAPGAYACVPFPLSL